MSESDNKAVAGGERFQRLLAVARHIENHVADPLPLAELAQVAGLSESHLQRTFKAAFGISPKVYQDALRMGRFKHALKQHSAVTEAIFDAGYGSISRLYGEPSRTLGMTPSAYRAGGAGEAIDYACRQTLLGTLLMAATGRGVCFVQFGTDESTLLELLKAEFPKAELKPSSAQDSVDLDLWIDALNLHISQGGPRPDLPLDVRGTAFQILVWQFLIQIPEGEVISYAELASGIGKPGAVRAAASACARNRIGVLIPCHRVLRGDGRLGGYRWGLERKQALIDAEKQRTAKS